MSVVFYSFYRLSFNMHNITMLVLIVSGIVLCMVDPSFSSTCNCHCGHTYHGASTDDSSKAPYINTNNGNGIYWIRLTGMIQ